MIVMVTSITYELNKRFFAITQFVDIDRHPELKMAVRKPEVGITYV
jgi:hypothetical protein